MDNPDQKSLPADASAEIERLRQIATDAERRLREEIYLNSAMTRTVLHDLKNPLTVTLGNLQVIKMLSKDTLSEKTRRLLDAAEEGCYAQLTIINNFADLTKLDTGALTYRSVRLDPYTIIKSQIQILSRLDALKSYWLNESPEQLWLMGDPDAFTRIIRNLLDNSMRHTRSGGRIEATITRMEGSKSVEIIIQDNGEIIPAEMLEAIFDKRNHVLSDHTGKRGDAGIGLAYSRTAARAMGGDLSAAPCDAGVRFELILPSVVD